jgi:glutamate dehydrogenase (NAD(P)+)
VCLGIAEAVRHREDMTEIGLQPGLEGKKVILQGLGNVGYYTALHLAERGAVIVGVAEYNGGILSEKGLDIASLKAYQLENGSFEGFSKGTFVPDGQSLLEAECDILVPAALENQITAQNAHRIRARIVAEAANGPVDFEAEKILQDRGVLLIPDVYLNAGGVTVSYFEWLKNLSHVSFDRMTARYMENSKHQLVEVMERLVGHQLSEENRRLVTSGPNELEIVRTALAETMARSYHAIHDLWKTRDLPDLRTASYAYAIDQVAASYLAHGIFP